MTYKNFNIYFICSCVLFAIMFIIGITDERRNFVDNDVFMLILLSSLLNVAYACYIGTKTPKD